MTSRTPTLGELIRVAIDARLAGVHVSIPGRVESYDAAKQRVNVKPLVKTEHGESVPVISDVPVIFPGGGSFRVVFPLAKGDTVLLVFCERSIDGWKNHGGEVDPIDTRHHALSDAVAYAGLRAFNDALTDAPTDSMKIGKDGGSAQAEFKNDEIVLAGGSAEVARKGDATNSGTLKFEGLALTWTSRGGAKTIIGTLAGQVSVTPGPTPASIDGEIIEGAARVKA